MAISVDIIRPVTRNILRNPGDNPFGGFLPSDLGNLAAWYRFNQGITVTGSGVSQWGDQSGNGRHLPQVTDAARPSKESDGSILFDGVSEYLSASFPLVRPTSVYVRMKQVTWNGSQTFFDGFPANFRMCVGGTSTTPRIRFFDSAAVIGTSTDLAVDTYGAVFMSEDGTDGTGQINNNTPITGTLSGHDMNGFWLGSARPGQLFSNIQVKEVIIYSVAHDAATRTKVINYLNTL